RFYPGVADVLSATQVDLRSGESLRGVNLSLESQRFAVSGQVQSGALSGTGSVAHLRGLHLANGIVRSTNVIPGNGLFEFEDVPPGKYLLTLASDGADDSYMPAEVDVMQTNVF